MANIIDIRDLVLFCPNCEKRHIDYGEWKTRPHKMHLCAYCGFLWQPLPFHTRGIADEACG